MERTQQQSHEVMQSSNTTTSGFGLMAPCMEVKKKRLTDKKYMQYRKTVTSYEDAVAL